LDGRTEILKKTKLFPCWKNPSYIASFRTTPLSAAAAAVQAAQGELEASKLERCAVGALSGHALPFCLD